MKQVFHNGMTALFRSRDFAIAAAARFIATVGMGAVVVTLMLHLQSNGHGPWAVSGMLLTATIPLVLLAPWAGTLADTQDSRTLTTGASLVAALCIAGMAVSMGLFENYLPALYILVLLMESALAVALPAWQALVPRIVGEEQTPRAVGTMQATLMLAQLVGPAVGGILAGQGGARFSFWIASACYLVLAAGSFSIRTRRGTAAERHGKDKPLLMDGLRVLNRDTVLWSLVVGALFVILVAEAVNVLEVFLARETLGASKTQYGLLSTSAAAGLVAGSLLAGSIRTETTRIRAYLLSLLSAGAMIFAMGVSPTLLVLFMTTAAMGFGCGVLNATFGAIIILRTPEQNRGQVMAVTTGLMRGVSVVSILLGGLIGSLWDPRTGFMLSGGAAVAVSLILISVVLKKDAKQPPEPVPTPEDSQPAPHR